MYSIYHIFTHPSKELSHCLGIDYYVNFLVRLGSNGFQLKLRFGVHGNWKDQNPGGHFGATTYNSANTAHLLQIWAKWAELAVVFSR